MAREGCETYGVDGGHMGGPPYDATPMTPSTPVKRPLTGTSKRMAHSLTRGANTGGEMQGSGMAPSTSLNGRSEGRRAHTVAGGRS